MNNYLLMVGSTAGLVGTMVCFIAGLARFAGYYYIAGYQSTTLFNVGVGLMVFACLIKLEKLLSVRQG